jgi:hypothetical protein
MYQLPVQDSGVYSFKCPQGHENIVLVPQMKFEVLFEIGLNAILDGYYRDAVASIAAALERFYEFYVRVIGHHKNSEMEFEAVWKHLSRHSERQLGAFVLAYAIHFGYSPTLLSTKQVEFRNDVIHRGKIPSASEACGFGNAVLALILNVLPKLRNSSEESVQYVINKHLGEILKKIEPKRPTSTYNMPLILRPTPSEGFQYPAKVETRLGQLIQRRTR